MDKADMRLPDEWQNDQAMDVLFSPFRDSREINPKSWDKKMKFWTDVIMDYCKTSGTVYIEVNQLPLCFERKGKNPVCLNRVISELLSKQVLQTYEEFSTITNSTWLNWGLNWVVKKPATWTMNTFIKRPLTWTFNKLVGTESDETPNNLAVIVTKIAQEKANLLLQNHQKSVVNETTDCIVGYSDFYNRNKDLFKDEKNFDIVLMQLIKDNKCVVFQTESHQKVIRFGKSDKRSVTPPNECDNQIYKLKSTESALQNQIENLTKEINKLREEAKELIKRGLKPSALNVLRKKKKVESVRAQKETALLNIHQLIISIQETDSNKMIMDAYRSGNEAYKQLSKDYGLSPDNIDDIMSDMEETFEIQDDINKSMSVNPSNILEPSMEELEHELSDILSEGNDSGGFFGGDLPEVPTHTPVGFTNITPEKGNVRDTKMVQELVDALNAMPDIDDDFDLELPEVPQFSPEKPSAMSRPSYL